MSEFKWEDEKPSKEEKTNFKNPIKPKSSTYETNQNENEVGYYKPPFHKTTGFKVILGVIIGIVLIVLYNIGNSGKQELTLEELKTKYKPLELVTNYWLNEEYSSYIVGVVQNNTEDSFTYAEIRFFLYDKNNNQIGTALANIAGLEAKGKWKFKALVYEKECKYFKFDDIYFKK